MNQISLLVAKNLKFVALMFNLMKHCFKPYDIYNIHSRSVLQYQHQWELEQKKTDDLNVPKLDKSNWTKTMKAIVLYLRLLRGVQGVPMAYVVRQHIIVAHILPGYDTQSNLDNNMIARAPIIDTKSDLKMTQDGLNKTYVSWQCDTIKVDNALVHQILSKIFMDMDAYVNLQQRKYHYGQTVYFDVHQWFLSSDQVIRQDIEAEKKLQNSHYDDKKKQWD